MLQTWLFPRPKIEGIGENPYDALITGDGRHYIAGLFGEDGLTALDLWQSPPEPRHLASAVLAPSAEIHGDRRSLEGCQ